MIKISTIKIFSNRQLIASVYDRKENWQDPHGGVFTEVQKHNLDMVAQGHLQSIMLDRYYDGLSVSVVFEVPSKER